MVNILFLAVDGVLFVDGKFNKAALSNLKKLVDSDLSLTVSLIDSWGVEDEKLMYLYDVFNEFQIPVSRLVSFLSLARFDTPKTLLAHCELFEPEISYLVITRDTDFTKEVINPNGKVIIVEDRLTSANVNEAIKHLIEVHV